MVLNIDKTNKIWYYKKTGDLFPHSGNILLTSPLVRLKWEAFMINLVEDIRSISYVKSHTAEVMKQVGEKNNPMVITQNGEARAVLMDVKQYQNIINSINLMKILSIGENDLKNGRIYSHEELQKKIRSILD